MPAIATAAPTPWAKRFGGPLTSFGGPSRGATTRVASWPRTLLVRDLGELNAGNTRGSLDTLGYDEHRFAGSATRRPTRRKASGVSTLGSGRGQGQV